MSEARICPECGSDIYAASHYEELRQARDRHWAKNKQQALQILDLQLKVAELEEWRRTRNRKIERQRRTIVRLQEKLRNMGAWPHDDKTLGGGEGPPVSPVPAVSEEPPTEPGAPDYPSARGLNQMRSRVRKAAASEGS